MARAAAKDGRPRPKLQARVQQFVANTGWPESSHQLADMQVEHASNEEHVHPIIQGVLSGLAEAQQPVVMQQAIWDPIPAEPCFQFLEVSLFVSAATTPLSLSNMSLIVRGVCRTSLVGSEQVWYWQNPVMPSPRNHDSSAC